MSHGFDDPEYTAAPASLPTDTLVDSVVILLALTVVQRLVGFGRAMLFCRWLDPEQLGVWDMAFSFLVLAAPLSVLAIPGVFGRYVERYRQRGQLRLFLRRTGLACILLAVVAFLGVLWGRRWFSVLVFGSDDQANTIALAAGCLITVIAYNFLVELFTALRNIRLVSATQLVNSVTFAALGVTLLLAWECTATSVLVAYAASCTVAAVWAGCRLPRVWHSAPVAVAPPPDARFWSHVAPFAAWVLLGSVLMNLFGVIDRYMIVHFSRMSASEALDVVGNYYSSRVVPLLLVSIASMLATMSMPHLSHDWEAGRRDLVATRLRLFLKLFGFALSAAAVVVLLAAPLLFGVAFRGKFPGGAAVLPWTLLYCAWFGMLLVMQNYLLCAEKARLASTALAGGLAVNVALNVVLVPRLGLQGAVLSTTAANAVSLGLVCLFNRRLGFHLDSGAAAVLVLPLLLCLGVWPAAAGLMLVAAYAAWGNRLLTADEKRQLADGVVQHVKRYGRRMRLPV